MNKTSKELNSSENFLQKVAQEPDTQKLAGIYYKVIKSGKGPTPQRNSVVMVYYKGMLTNGKVFDDNTRQNYPDALRVRDLIVGWQMALSKMKVGDKWKVYIPAEYGYGKKALKGIPKNSTLIFEIELVGIG